MKKEKVTMDKAKKVNPPKKASSKLDKTNSKVDWFFNKADKWQEEFKALREIILQFPVTEELKWGKPCYTVEENNIVLIHGFKEYCALLFLKGALLKDGKKILIQQTENVQAARQIRFANIREIIKMKTTLKAYIQEAIAVEKAGLKVELKKTTEFKMPQEFRNEIEKNSRLKTAFEALTPGRQRGYLLYFSSAKQAKTREARIEKCMDRIFDGMGLDD